MDGIDEYYDITIKFYLKVAEHETKMCYQDWILECQHWKY